MPKVRLTDAAVQRYKAAAGERIEYFDRALPGFALRVSGPSGRNPQGHKAWVLYCRARGKLRRLTIEPAYPALGLADARKKAAAALRAIEAGEDPVAEKQAAKAAPVKAAAPDTVENVVDEFIKRHLTAQHRAPRYVVETRRNFDRHVLPRWRGRLLGSITRREVIQLLDDINDEGTPIAANRVKAAISAMMNWAIRRGIIEHSPAARVERPGKENRRERTLSASEIAAMWDAAAAMPYPFGPYFRLLLATGQRREEVARMRWQDLDPDERIWTIPAEMTKPGRAQVVPLSQLAWRVIEECPRRGEHVFTSRQRRGAAADGRLGDAPISGYSKAKMAIDTKIAGDEAAPVAPWTIHDLRRTAATMMAKAGVSRFVIARVLNHADSGVTSIYDRHEYLAEKRHALELWAQQIENLTAPPGANVIPLRAEA